MHSLPVQPFHFTGSKDLYILKISYQQTDLTTCKWYKREGSPYSITERRVPELIPVLGSQTAEPSGRLPLLSARPTVTLATFKRAATNFAAW